jgi:uncharacterized delta-60 repeat protein
MALILRRDKGSKLSITELDANFEYLNSKSSSTGDITFAGTTMSSNIVDKDIVIETKGEGGVVIQNDKPNSWVLNVGLKFNYSGDVWGSSVTVDDEGNSYTTGGDYLVSGGGKGFVIKTNKIGEIIWQKHIKEFAYGESIVYKNGHLYILLTETANSYGMLLIKLDTDGNSLDQWSFDYPIGLDSNNPYRYEIDIDEDENVYWVGFLYMNSNIGSITSGYNLVTGKLNTVSNTNEWNLLLDSGDYVDFGYSIKYKNNFIYLTGTTRNTDGQNIILITKLDTDGNQIWSKTIDDLTPSQGESITIDNLNNVYVCGSKDDSGSNFYLKLDSAGNILWSKELKNSLNQDLQINSIYAIDFNIDGFLYISTVFNNDFIIFKIDTNGNIIWQNIVGTNTNEYTHYNNGHRSIKSTNDSLYVTGYNYDNIVPNNDRYGTEQSNMFLIKYDLNGLDNNTFQDWTIISSSFSQIDYTFATFSNISLTTATFSHPITKTHFEIIDVVIPGNTNFGFDSYLTNFSNKKTQLKVKGEINVNDLYVLPESTGKSGEVLTYPDSGNTLQWDKPGTTLTINDFIKSSWMFPAYTTNFGDDSQISLTSSYRQIIGQKEVNILTIYNYYLGGTITIKRRGSSDTNFEWEFGEAALQMGLAMNWNDGMLSVDEIYSDQYDKKFRIRSSGYNTSGNSVVGVEYTSGGLTASIETIQGYSSGNNFTNEYVEIDFKDYPYYPNSGGTVDHTFVIGDGFNNMVFNIETQSDGKILVAGIFYDTGTYDGNICNSIARLNIDGTFDKTFESSVGFNDQVKALKIQSDGKILVGGSFTTYSGLTSSRIIRLNSNGSVDKSFNIGTGFNNIVRAIEIQSNGKILVGGDFSNYNGTYVQGIIRLNSDGTIDTSFVSGDGFSYSNNGNVFVIKVLSTGNILVGGWFYDYNGNSTNNLIELDSDGGVTNTFDGGTNTSFDDRVSTIVEQPDGKILLGGFFTSPGERIVRLNTDFSVDNRFNDSAGSGFNGAVQVIKLQSDGKILCGGQFNQYYDDTYLGGEYRSCSKLARLNSNGTFDTTFDVVSGFDGNVNAIVVQSDDKILVGGWFIRYNSIRFNRIIRLYSGSGLEAQYLQPEFMGVKYDKVAVSANSYLTFGGGSSLPYIDTLNLPGIFISAATNNTNNTRGYYGVYAGFYVNSDNETIFKIRYYDSDISFSWEVCFIINTGNTIDIKISYNDYIDNNDIGFTAIKDTNFIRKEFTPTSYSNYYLPQAWGTRDLKSDSIKLNNAGITYLEPSGDTDPITEVNLPFADSDWTAPNAYEQEWKVRTYNGSNYLSMNGSDTYTWFDFNLTPYGGQNLKGGIIDFHLHDSLGTVQIGSLSFNTNTGNEQMISVNGSENYVSLANTGIGDDTTGTYGVRTNSSKTGYAVNFWVHWTSKLFYGSY